MMEPPSTSLHVPYGVAPDGSLVAALSAVREVTYTCPGCKSLLILKAGAVRVPHFAHATNEVCEAETLLHRLGKRLVVQAIEANARGQHAIRLQYACRWCGNEESRSLPPNTFSEAYEEERVGPFVCDVVAAVRGTKRLAVEVVVTHEMEPDKVRDLPLRWIEVLAEDVVASPTEWRATSARLEPCARCKPAVYEVAEVAERFGIPTSAYHPLVWGREKPFVAAVQDCFKCGERIPVFHWKGTPFAQDPPPEPRSRTLAYRYSKRWGGKYWTNTCANCGVTQGDNFLYGAGQPFEHLASLEPLGRMKPIRSMNDLRSTDFFRSAFGRSFDIF